MPLTTEEIHAAADAIVESGERPTLAAVRRAVGGGSFTTISEAMQDWRARHAQAHVLADVEVPETVSERIAQLQGALWQAALAEAEARLAAEREALREAEAESSAAVAEAREAVRTLESEAEEREKTVESLEGRLEEARKALADAARESDDRLEAERTARREAEMQQARVAAQFEGLEARLADAQRTLDALVARVSVSETTEKAEKPPSAQRKKK